MKIMARGKHRKSSGFKKSSVHRRKKFHLDKLSKKSSPKNFTNDVRDVKPVDKLVVRNDHVARSEEEYAESSSSEEENNFKELLSTFTQVSTTTGRFTVQSEEDSTSPDEEEAAFLLSSRTPESPIKEQLEIEDETSEEVTTRQQGDTGEEDDSSDESSEEEENLLDSFISHFNFDLESSLLEAVTNEPPHLIKSKVKWPVLGNLSVVLPTPDEKSKSDNLLKRKTFISEKKTYAKQGIVPKIVEGTDWSKFYIKSQIQNNLTKANYQNLKNDITQQIISLTPLQRELLSIIFRYQDLYFPGRTFHNCEEIRFVYCLHAVNHILKTRLRILHHNAKLSKKEDVPDEFRDQGLVRPKVLMLVPFKSSALRIVEMIISILMPDEKANVINKSRFFEEFGGNSLIMPKKNPKPEDYEITFAGNTDDTFRIGLSVTKKSLKLYADFYAADIIIASPLGLRIIIGAEGEKDRDFDFLASIEVLILDQTEIFLMQNWDHVLHIINHFHLQPKATHGTDFSRVHMWAINGWTKFYRQSLIFSAANLPEITSLFSRHCCNYSGHIIVDNPPTIGTVSAVIVQVPQVFNKFEASSPVEAIEIRFDHFIKKVLPQYKDNIMKHTLIYVPSYFDFVKIRNFFKKEDISFVQICEYSKEGKIARARDMFFHSDAHFLLYSERLHFFRRLRIKGIRHIIFYQLPTFCHFYDEMCNLMQEANQNPDGGNESNMTVTVLYSKYDAQRLAPVVGFDRAVRMISSKKNFQMLLTGE